MEKFKSRISKLNRKSVLAILVTAAVFTFVAVSTVACGGHGKKMSPKLMQRMVLSHVDDVMDDIDATDTQRQTFDGVANDILKDALAMKNDHQKHKKELLSILSQPTPDREAVRAHIEEKLDKMEEFAMRNADRILDAYETLDPDQRQIVIEKLENHMDNH